MCGAISAALEEAGYEDESGDFETETYRLIKDAFKDEFEAKESAAFSSELALRLCVSMPLFRTKPRNTATSPHQRSCRLLACCLYASRSVMV